VKRGLGKPYSALSKAGRLRKLTCHDSGARKFFLPKEFDIFKDCRQQKEAWSEIKNPRL
jgi:hypothetical protein